MDIQEQKELKALQDEGCRIKVEHSHYVSDCGTVFEYTAEYVAENQGDDVRRIVGEFGYRSNVYYDAPLREVRVSEVWICKRFKE